MLALKDDPKKEGGSPSHHNLDKFDALAMVNCPDFCCQLVDLAMNLIARHMEKKGKKLTLLSDLVIVMGFGMDIIAYAPK